MVVIRNSRITLTGLRRIKTKSVQVHCEGGGTFSYLPISKVEERSTKSHQSPLKASFREISCNFVDRFSVAEQQH
jgi:2-succinyl-5-enolpyruvyl-6-hydroxy-3-cyclohexene-1-carboxylate synthase